MGPVQEGRASLEKTQRAQSAIENQKCVWSHSPLSCSPFQLFSFQLLSGDFCFLLSEFLLFPTLAFRELRE
jgi:predicted Ser/Thr protein kinase